jgi:hypothetical protein
MRDSYDETDTGFAEWRATGDIGAYDWGDHLDVVRQAATRGIRIRRVRVVSEPLSSRSPGTGPPRTRSTSPNNPCPADAVRHATLACGRQLPRTEKHALHARGLPLSQFACTFPRRVPAI